MLGPLGNGRDSFFFFLFSLSFFSFFWSMDKKKEGVGKSGLMEGIHTYRWLNRWGGSTTTDWLAGQAGLDTCTCCINRRKERK